MTSTNLSSFTRPGVVAGVAGVGLVSSYLVAIQEPVPEWELRLTEAINDAPDAVATLLYPVMQLGTLAGPAVVAVGVVAFRRDWWLGGVTLVAGVVSWVAAKAIKAVVDRGRPRAYLSDIDVREGDGSGLGYISGHSAVAATAAVMAMAAMPRTWRPAAAVLALLVGQARIVHGVHLPADVVGGWSFGTLVALGALALVDRIESTVGTPRGRRTAP